MITQLKTNNCYTDIVTILKLLDYNKTYTKPKLQDLPDEYLWVNDMLILKQGCTYEKGRLGEEPDEVKVSRPVLKTSRVG